jgi:hypothetical protein
MNNAATPAAQANARDTATPTQPGFRSANFRATKYETPTPTNIASNVGTIGEPLTVGGSRVGDGGTLLYYSPRRNPTSTPCKHHPSSGVLWSSSSRRAGTAGMPGPTMAQKVGQRRGASIAGTGRGANQNWYGVADRLPFMACPGAPKVAKSKLRFPLAPELLSWWCDVTWVILKPSAVRSVTARCRLSIRAIVRSFTVSPEGCSPEPRGSAKCAKCGNRSQELNSRPAISPR